MIEQLSPKEQEQLETFHKQHYFIWLAMIFSLFIYVVVCLSFFKESLDPEQATLFRYVFGGLAVASVGGAWLYRKIRFNEDRLVTQDRNEAVPRSLQDYRVTLIVCLALAEAAGLFGLILYMFSLNQEDLIAFMGLALIGHMYFRPDQDAMEQHVKNQLSKAGS